MKPTRHVFALALMLVGCGDSTFGSAVGSASNAGVGDPCLPPEPSHTPMGASCAPDAGCFEGSEVYLQTESTQCRTHRCAVYHWDEASSPMDQSERAFCTCRCSGLSDTEPLCGCPNGFVCQTFFVVGDPGLQGGYCIPSEIAPTS